MALAAGTRLGSYEILGPLGKGGMGEVYLGRDTRLGRDVAIKILPGVFASDPDRLARFEREAKTLAALNHPHIAQIHGLQESDSIRALVMELVDGDDLSVLIERGPMPQVEALGIAAQIADALAAAHDRGIVHRDLKPSNVKVREDGTVKVLDFGLAKLAPDGVSGSGGLIDSPTITSPATQLGVILGTAAYMAPEQAKGRAVDRRADVWAFGAVLYEMLTARRAFEGEDVSDTLAFIITREPDWEALPAGTPAGIRRLLRRCLQKDRARRLDSLSVARFEIEDALAAPTPAQEGSATPVAQPGRTTAFLALVATAIAAAAIAGAAVWWAMRSAPVSPPMIYLEATPSLPDRLYLDGQTTDLDISPDGTRMAYLAYRGKTQYPELFIRRFGEPAATVLPNTANAQDPFFSPDGEWVGFGQNNDLRKISVHGGPPVTICVQCTQGFRGGAFMEDGSVLFSNIGGTTGIRRIASGGGAPEIITRVDSQRGERSHTFPYLLPGSRAIVYGVASMGGEERVLVAQELDGGTKKTLVRGVRPRYLPSGHLLYVSEGTMFAVAFDLNRLETIGSPAPVADNVLTKTMGTADYAIGPDGSLVYVEGDVIQSEYALRIGPRQGNLRAGDVPAATYIMARFSPDGTRAVLDSRSGDYDLWLWDLRSKVDRLTFGPGRESYPVWAPDNATVYFLSVGSDRPPALYSQSADRIGSPTFIVDMPGPMHPTTISPDGKWLVAHVIAGSGEGSPGLYLIALDGDHRPRRIEGAAPGAMNADLSPDGKWIAYQAADSIANTPEVYVQPFPQMTAGRRQVSPAGGTQPLWSRVTGELLFRDMERRLLSVPVRSTPALTYSAPEVVREHTAAPGPARAFDLSPDGKSVLLVDEVRQEQQSAPPPRLRVVLNWVEDLKKKVPTGK